MIRGPPISTRTDTLLPSTTLVRARPGNGDGRKDDKQVADFHGFLLSNSAGLFNWPNGGSGGSSTGFPARRPLTLARGRALSAAMPDSPRPKRPRVIVTRQLMPHVEARMAELFEVVLSARDHAFSEGELKTAVQDCDVLVPTVNERIDADNIHAEGARMKL